MYSASIVERTPLRENILSFELQSGVPKKALNIKAFIFAPRVGFEPTTNRLHRYPLFLDGVDYIITMFSIERLGGRRFPRPCVGVLPEGIVSEPFATLQEVCATWLLITIRSLA